MTNQMFSGPLFVPAASASVPPSRTLPSGLVLPDLSWAAGHLGLMWAGNDWLNTVVHAYLRASEYFGEADRVKGFEFEPQVWVETLVRMYPAEAYLHYLAKINRATRSAEDMSVYQDRFLRQLQPGLRMVAATALGGRVDGQPRWFLARQPVLRAMHLVLTTPIPAQDPDPRVAQFLRGIGPETAAIVLAHLAADTLSQPSPAEEPQLGGAAESFAMEMVCNHIFNEPHNPGAMLGRAWAMWTRHGAALADGPLGKSAVDLLGEATKGLTLAEVLAVGNAYLVQTIANRVDGPVRIPVFNALRLPPEKVELFLDLFATDVAGLRADFLECPKPWQMLPLQNRPLLRLGDDVIILDEPFLLEAITDGLYWRVFNHLATVSRTARDQWATEYGKQVIEPFAEELIQEIAPVIVGGPRPYFAEEDIKSAYQVKKSTTPPNTDAGIEFPDGTVLFEIVKKPMSVPTRTGSAPHFKQDVEAAVFKKVRQLDAVAGFMQQNPQPPGSPLSAPAARVFPVVVAGNHFPLNPITWTYIHEELDRQGLLQRQGVEGLFIVDLDELEALGTLAHAGELLPSVLANWRDSDFGRGSFATYMWKNYGAQPLSRSARAEKNVADAMAAFRPLLVASDESAA